MGDAVAPPPPRRPSSRSEATEDRSAVGRVRAAPRLDTRGPLVSAVGLALGPAAALGWARFAYSLLLPTMRADLHWSFAQAGAMNTANAVGYLAGAITAGPLVSRVGSRQPYLAAFGLTALALLAEATTTHFAALIALRLVAGVSGAVVFISGAGLMTQVVRKLPPGRSAALLGTYFAGGGLGIVISAVALPPLVGLTGGGSWRWGWVVLGGASVLALAGSAPAALSVPQPSIPPGHRLFGWPVRRLAPTLVAYGLFGAGYIAYITFIVAFLHSQGMTTATISAFWAVLGAASVFGVFAWSRPLGRLHGGRGPAMVLAVTTLGALLPLLVASTGGDFASAALFGGAFLAVVTAITDMARRSLAVHHVAPAIAVLTVAFGIGQSLGPIFAGVLSTGPSGVRTGLGLGVALLSAATLVALSQRALPTVDHASQHAQGRP